MSWDEKWNEMRTVVDAQRAMIARLRDLLMKAGYHDTDCRWNGDSHLPCDCEVGRVMKLTDGEAFKELSKLRQFMTKVFGVKVRSVLWRLNAQDVGGEYLRGFTKAVELYQREMDKVAVETLSGVVNLDAVETEMQNDGVEF